jgi:hypothetical protein
MLNIGSFSSSAFRFVQALSTAIFFFVSPYLDLQFSILVVSSFLILGYLNYFFLDLCVASVEGDKEQTRYSFIIQKQNDPTHFEYV